MEVLNVIRNYYQPIQPTTMMSDNDISYIEAFPNELLKSFIYCYWHLKSEKLLAQPFVYRVIADGCIDVFFPLENPEESYVMGFCKRYTEFNLGMQFNYFGIRFLPAIFPLIFKQNAKELSNTDVQLNLILPSLSQFISHKINGLKNFQQITAIFDSFFIKHLRNTDFQIDNRFYNALGLILKSQGNIQIINDLDTGVSPRQLRRMFEFYVGDTAKTFSQIVRFQSVINNIPTLQTLNKSKLFYDKGYYDQSHFIKEFKNFYGVTPNKIFKN